MSTQALLSILFTGAVVAIYLSVGKQTKKIAENFVNFMEPVVKDSSLLNIFDKVKPKLWFVVDDYGVNSRRWVDFGSRNTTDINIGFLNITKTKCSFTQGNDFAITELLGRDAVAKVIRDNRGLVPLNHKLVPHFLWREWARAALLKYAGGLYLDGLSLCLGPSFKNIVADKDIAVFGVDQDEPITMGNSISSPYCGWSAKPNHSSWSNLCEDIYTLIEAGPQSWTSAEVRNQRGIWFNRYLGPNTSPLRSAEWSRKSDGLPIEIDDLLGRSPSQDWLPPVNSVYVPIDLDRLERSVSYKWFMRMSTEQILNPESYFIWASLAQK